MNAVCSSYGNGLYVAGEWSSVFWGRLTVPGAKGIIGCPGSHSVAIASLFDSTYATFAANGFIAASMDMGQTTTQGSYGNDTARTRIGQLRTFIQGSTSPVAAKAGKVHLLGSSGGATAAINYARANAANVASMFLICPLVDVEDFYTNWLNAGANGNNSPPSGATQSEINKAYNNGVDDGGTAYTAAMPTHNPYRSGNQAALSAIPMKLAYSDNDPYIPVSKATGYAALVNAAGGNAVAYSQGAVGHSGAGVSTQDIVSFFQAHP